jgi:endonuclease YncB( thermonuclease family)
MRSGYRLLTPAAGLFAAATAFAAACSVSALAQPAPAACRLDDAGGGTVRQVTDGRTFTLDDGREVRLAGIEVPAPPSGAPGGSPQASSPARAKAGLESLILGKPVTLKRLGARTTDRYGRLLAYVFVPSEGLEGSVQRDMLVLGLARVAAHVGDRVCAAELLAREREARDAGRALWADPDHATRRADNPAAILGDRGRFALVEGSVLSVRESGGTIYMNFGRRWSEDFTVTIAKRNERMFSAAGLEPKKLERARVRVRGFVEERGGPWIEASRPEQIEILDRE